MIHSITQIHIPAKLHESRQGIEKTWQRVRVTLYWKNILNKDIDELVRKIGKYVNIQLYAEPNHAARWFNVSSRSTVIQNELSVTMASITAVSVSVHSQMRVNVTPRPHYP